VRPQVPDQPCSSPGTALRSHSNCEHRVFQSSGRRAMLGASPPQQKQQFSLLHHCNRSTPRSAARKFHTIGNTWRHNKPRCLAPAVTRSRHPPFRPSGGAFRPARCLAPAVFARGPGALRYAGGLATCSSPENHSHRPAIRVASRLDRRVSGGARLRWPATEEAIHGTNEPMQTDGLGQRERLRPYCGADSPAISRRLLLSLGTRHAKGGSLNHFPAPQASISTEPDE